MMNGVEAKKLIKNQFSWESDALQDTFAVKKYAYYRNCNLYPKDDILYLSTKNSPENIFRFIIYNNLPNVTKKIRTCHIMAAICIVAESKLKEAAIELLKNSHGKNWIDFRCSENNTCNFAYLMLQVAEYALTCNEEQHMRAIIRIAMLKEIGKRVLNVSVAYLSNRRLSVDDIYTCKKCNQYRSKFLLTNESCLICTSPDKKCVESSALMYECSNCQVNFVIKDTFYPENKSCVIFA